MTPDVDGVLELFPDARPVREEGAPGADPGAALELDGQEDAREPEPGEPCAATWPPVFSPARRPFPRPPERPHWHEELVAKVSTLAGDITKASTVLCTRLPRPDRLSCIWVERRELLRVQAELAAAVTALKALERHVGRLART
jgi:hypothetical protein